LTPTQTEIHRYCPGCKEEGTISTAKAGSLDHIGPGIITVYYRVIYQRINSGARWSIYSGGRWSGYPAYA
jgi:hypothetical protein